MLTIEINPNYAQIARRIHEHAGLENIIRIHVGTVETSPEAITQAGPFDLVFIDHVKRLYISDLLLLESYGMVKQGTVVAGDNIVCPGAPEYLEHMKNSPHYDSTLYHSYLEYSEQPDAVLVSVRL